MASIKVKINGADSIRFVKGEDVPFTLRVLDAVTLAPIPQPWTMTLLLKKADETTLEVPITAIDYVAGVGSGEIAAADTTALPVANDQTAELRVVTAAKTTFGKLLKFLSVEARAF